MSLAPRAASDSSASLGLIGLTPWRRRSSRRHSIHGSCSAGRTASPLLLLAPAMTSASVAARSKNSESWPLRRDLDHVGVGRRSPPETQSRESAAGVVAPGPPDSPDAVPGRGSWAQPSLAALTQRRYRGHGTRRVSRALGVTRGARGERRDGRRRRLRAAYGRLADQPVPPFEIVMPTPRYGPRSRDARSSPLGPPR